MSTPQTPFTVSENIEDIDKKEITVQFLPKRPGTFKGSITITWDSKYADETSWDSAVSEEVYKNQKTIIPLTHKDSP